MIGITLGDPAGIGPEITLKAIEKIHSPQTKIRLIGSLPIFEALKKRLTIKFDLAPLVYDVIPEFPYQFGLIQKSCAIAALNALEVAIELLKSGRIKGLVTAPVCKESLRLIGFKYPGHTEFLAQTFKVKRYAMLAYSPHIKIVLVTIHQPVGKVAKSITANKVLEKILLLNDFLTNQLLWHKPKSGIKIGVLAFNPHSFEFSLGEEERIVKAIRQAKKLGVKAFGPFPSDTINELINRFDGLVAMYHDQGMIPLKLLARNQGVNITLGLPYPRTSPLHGCALDIAGKGIANPSSMLAAIKLGLQLIGLKVNHSSET